MADRGSHRGGRGGYQHRGGRGGGRGGAAYSGGAGGDHKDREKPKKENILDLNKYMDKRITVKFNGGREGKLSLGADNPAFAVKVHFSCFWDCY